MLGGEIAKGDIILSIDAKKIGLSDRVTFNNGIEATTEQATMTL